MDKILSEEEKRSFIVAVAEAVKNEKSESLCRIRCPCGGKIKFWYSECNGHRTIIAKCNRCHQEIKGSSGALEAYERECEQNET